MEKPSLRDTLARNLLRLIDAETPPGKKRSVRAWALTRNLDVRLITRLSQSQNSVTLDTLQEIADACGLQPWHLLYEDFDPAAPPDSPVSEEDKAMIRKLRRLLGAP